MTQADHVLQVDARLPSLKEPRAVALPLVTYDAESGIVGFNLDPSPAVMRQRITALKDRLLALPEEDQAAFPVEHSLVDGVYTRKLLIKKGQILVGKIHKKACQNIVAKGDITVVTETGALRVQAGYSVVSPAGIQKVGYAHEDTIFINVFRTDSTDIAEIEAEIACESFAELPTIEHESKVKLCL